MQRKVVGIGSPFGGDRSGWVVVERLRRERLPESVGVEQFDRPGVGLLQAFEGVEAVVLVDAVLLPAERCGQLLLFDQEQLRLRSQSKLSLHATGVAEVIALGEALRMLPSRLWLLGITLAEPTVEPPPRQIEQAVELLLAWMRAAPGEMLSALTPPSS